MKTGEFMLDARQRTLRDANGRVFDLAAHQWRVDEGTVSGRKISSIDALRWLQRDSGRPRREPVAVVGGRRAGAADLERAHALGAALAKVGIVVLCGGRGGVMRAVCEGVATRAASASACCPATRSPTRTTRSACRSRRGCGIARNA